MTNLKALKTIKKDEMEYALYLVQSSRVDLISYHSRNDIDVMTSAVRATISHLSQGVNTLKTCACKSKAFQMRVETVLEMGQVQLDLHYADYLAACSHDEYVSSN